jgi:hypothetical protein
MNLALPKCQMKGDPCISFAPDLTPLFHVVGWAFVVSLLVYLVFTLFRRR